MTLEDRAAQLSRAEIIALLQRQERRQARNAELERQNEWFKRQLFGRKSERRLLVPDAQQLPLAGMLPTREEPADVPPPTETVTAYQRRTRYSAPPEGKRKAGCGLMRPCRCRKFISPILTSLRSHPTPMR